MALRIAIPDFQLANPLYAGSEVSFFTVDGSGVKTATLATLYEAATGTDTLDNPQILDSEGKFAQPVYIEVPVIASVDGLSVSDHDTGIITIPGRWRGTWATATIYYAGEFVVGAAAPYNVYQVANTHTSGTFATDVSNGLLTLAIDLSQVITTVTAGSTRIAFAAAGGTVDAITADFSPDITPLVDGQVALVRASGANTSTTPSFAPDGGTARTIVKRGGALRAADIVNSSHVMALVYRASNTTWELLNPAAVDNAVTAFILTLLDDANAAAARSTLGLVIGTDVLAPTGSAAGLTNKPATIAITVVADTTALATGTAKRTFRMPFAMTLNAGSAGVRASLATTQTSGNIVTVDVNGAGPTSLLSTKLTVDNGEKTSTTADAPVVVSDTSLADDEEVTIDIDQIGDGTAKGLIVYLIGTRT